jgi:hypothetical protein
MIIKRTSKYDRNMKDFIVIEYCCAKMGRDMAENKCWEISEDGEMECFDYESGFSGNYCSHCGEKIIIE